MRRFFGCLLKAECRVTLRDDALAIWRAGVDAVDSVRLVNSAIAVEADELTVCSEHIATNQIEHIEVLGAGKAGAGMAAGVSESLRALPRHITVDGWVNVPADCVRSCDRIHLHAARPAGTNEPTAAGIAGTQEILRRVSESSPKDLCLILISGGGSALLPAPVPAVTLEEKLAVTRLLASRGATIQELNTVRIQLSEVKGGGLLRRCSAGRMIAVVISDVIGDPVDIIASGPTVPSHCSPADALRILDRYDSSGDLIPPSVRHFLQTRSPIEPENSVSCRNFIIGSNATALLAAELEAKRLGYEVVSLGSKNSGEASVYGRVLWEELRNQRSNAASSGRPVCLLAGGETTVTLAETDQGRKGGRNQEVVLGAVAAQPKPDAWRNLVLLSGGTDGEDGPTDAAGAVADEDLLTTMNRKAMDPDVWLRINNSYPFFDALNGLVRTGPTHTNVMDLAVGIVSK